MIKQRLLNLKKDNNSITIVKPPFNFDYDKYNEYLEQHFENRLFNKPVFFTSPPDNYQYPYILYPVKKLSEADSRNYEFLIIDTGIHDLNKWPHRYSANFFFEWRNIKHYENSWQIVPDYYDLETVHGVDMGDFDNVEATFEILEDLYQPNSNHLPVLQHTKQITPGKDIRFLKHNIKRFKRDIDKSPKQLAIPIKHTKNLRLTKLIFEVIRRSFKKTWIHALGIDARQLRKVAHLIDSWDTRSWGFARDSKFLKKILDESLWNKYINEDGSTKSPYRFNEGEEIDFFHDYLDEIPKYTNEKNRYKKLNKRRSLF